MKPSFHKASLAVSLAVACCFGAGSCGTQRDLSRKFPPPVGKPAPPPIEQVHVPSWGMGREMYVSRNPQLFAYLDRVVGDQRTLRDTIVRDFQSRDYVVAEERVLSGTSVSAVYEDLGAGRTIFVMIAEGDKVGLKYSIATNQENMMWHYGIMYGFPVVMIAGPASFLHHVNIGFAFFHDEDGASLNEVKQTHGRPVLKDGASVRILRLRPSLLGVPIN